MGRTSDRGKCVDSRGVSDRGARYRGNCVSFVGNFPEGPKDIFVGSFKILSDFPSDSGVHAYIVFMVVCIFGGIVVVVLIVAIVVIVVIVVVVRRRVVFTSIY